MPVYVALSKLTEEGSKTIKKNPERIKEVNSDIEAMGIKIVSQYALLGQFDFVTILEAPDNDTIVKMSVEIGSRGSVQLQTLPAVPADIISPSLENNRPKRKLKYLTQQRNIFEKKLFLEVFRIRRNNDPFPGMLCP